MFKIKGDNIYHTRGDTGGFTIELKDEDGKEISEYAATMSVKRKLRDEDYLFQVPLQDGVCDIHPEATKDLPYGDYFYDVQVTTKDGTVQTIGPFEYHLMADVTR